MNDAASARCLSPEEIEFAAASEPMTPEARGHAVACERCRTSVSEARLNQQFLRELIVDWSPDEQLPISTMLPDVSVNERSPTHALTDYRLMQEIHRGAQGIVHRAVHVPTGRPAAVKIMRVGSLRRRMRMQREASLAAGLRHPGIVTLHDCGELPDGRYAIAMELVDGEMLDAWGARLRAEEKDTTKVLRRMVAVIAATCDAVQHAHMRGVIHRDLKPSNIIVDAEDQPHVLDFGIARRGADERPAERVTLTGEIACTLSYAAPEQVSESSSHVDTRSDVYALGVVLYELVTGTSPYVTDTSVADAIDAIRSAVPKSPRSSSPLIDIDLDTIILKTLSKEMDRRYQSALALRADLLHWLSGEAIDARRDSHVYVLKKTLRRYRGPVVAATVIAMAILGGTIVAVVASTKSESARQLAALEQRRARDEAKRWEAVADVLHELIPAVDPEFAAFGMGPIQQAVTQLSDRLYAGLFAEDPQAQAAIYTAMGQVCAERGSPRMAEVQFREALRVVTMQEDPPVEQVAAARRRLADLLVGRNGLDEADALARSAVESLRPLGPTAHLELSSVLRTSAQIALARNDQSGAEALCREAMALRQSMDENDRSIAPIRQTLARVLLARGLQDEAEREARAALATTLVAVSDQHPDVADAIETLAACIATRDASRAEELNHLSEKLRSHNAGVPELDAMLRLKTDLLGPDNPDRIETVAARVWHWQRVGDWAKVSDASELALSEARRLMGEDTMVVADLLRAHYRGAFISGDVDGALRAMDERLKILRRILPGKDDVHLTVAMREIANHASDMGRIDIAEGYWRETVDWAESRLGSGSRECAWVFSQHAYFLFWDMHRQSEAFVEIERAIDALTRIDPEPSYHLATMELIRCSFYARVGDTEQAACSLRHFLAMCSVCPEVSLQRQRFFDWFYEPIVLSGDPTCCALLWEVRDWEPPQPRLAGIVEQAP